MNTKQEQETGQGNAPVVGQRVRLTAVVERFPHFLVEAGATGTITSVVEGKEINVKMDDHIDGCEEWDNEIIWMDDDLDYFNDQTEVIETVQEREYRRLYLQAIAERDELLCAVLQLRNAWVAPHKFPVNKAEFNLVEVSTKLQNSKC